MYLKSLTLRGFKSFAEKTTFKFEPGITSIVGPNGSGKSNITDAVLWVLGEQSPRSLRSGSMEDVIFAGSVTRQDLGLAEVALTMDNSDGLLPIEFSEVTIARRVFRTGDSEYYINKSSCRLLDIQELLSGSGLGRGLYSIIGQGRIEETLSAKPEERRVFIEEAAGVQKFKRRRDRAVRRLESMDANMVRLKDILCEVRRQIAPLKRQAQLAADYAGLTAEMKRYELSLAVGKLKELQGRWTSLEIDEAVASERSLGMEIDLAKIEGNAIDIERRLEAEEAATGGLAEKRRRIQSVEDRLHAAASLVAEKARNTGERLETLSADAVRYAARKMAVEKQIKQAKFELEQVDSAMIEGKKRLSGAETKQAEATNRSRELAERLGALEEGILADERVIGEYDAAVTNFDLTIRTGQAQLEMMREQRRAFEARRLDSEEDLAKANEGLEALESAAVETERILGELNGKKSALVEKLEKDRTSADEAERRAESCATRVKALEDTVEADPSTAAALAAGGDGGVGIVGEAIRVAPEYERAIEAVLGVDLACVVIKNTSVLKKLMVDEVESVRERLALLPEDRVKTDGKSEPGTSDSGLIPAISVVEFPERMKAAVEALLNGVYIASDLENALADDCGATIVTLNGEVVHANGKVVLGAKATSVGRLARRREIGELVEERALLEKRAAEERQRFEETAADLGRAIEEADEAARRLEDARVRMHAAAGRRDSLRGELESLTVELRAIDERTTGLAERLEEEAERLSTDRHSLDERRESLEAKKSELGSARASLETVLKAEAATSVEVSKVEVEYDAMIGQRRGIERRLNEVTWELSEVLAGAERDKFTSDRLMLVRERSAPLISVIEALAVASSGVSGRLEASYRDEATSLAGLRESLRGLRERAVSARSELDTSKEVLTQLRVKKAQLEVEVSTAVSRIVDELDVPLENALNEPAIEDPSGLEEKVARLKRKLASIGPVNPMAVEEHRELEERAFLFSGQIEDIAESRRALNKVIKAIDRRIDERYNEAFDKINEHFSRLFSYLFPGGRAELILTDPDDPDISGIDIIAQPSGKKLQRLSLLSGGEKALASLAFIFALYIDRPCPFYILDEAEAALDDINLHRLIKLLNEMKRDTQFLIVTHQRRTMEMSDALYGVSMQADGVSKLISQKFSEVVEVSSA